jgi:hypothetical protein
MTIAFAIAFASGFLVGALASHWICDRNWRRANHELYDCLLDQKRTTKFWRTRWVDIVKRLDEQDVRP